MMSVNRISLSYIIGSQFISQPHHQTRPGLKMPSSPLVWRLLENPSTARQVMRWDSSLMIQAPTEYFGILPSLGVLPFLVEDPANRLPFQLRSHASYGEISRSLLTRQSIGGILPWEIFVNDVLALSGQRACWKVVLFLDACPTELVLRDAVHKAFYPSQQVAKPKLPPRLTIGVESLHSLAKAQSRQWLDRWPNSHTAELIFKMLPLDLMLHAFEAEALDAIIAPSPWGFHAEFNGLGKRDPHFQPGKFAQHLVMACHRDFLELHPDLAQSMPPRLAMARQQLKYPTGLSDATSLLSKLGKLTMRSSMIEEAAALHSFHRSTRDTTPDIPRLIAELMSLEDLSVLPSQVIPDEQTARLLLPTSMA
jgi:hypothetical protein